MRRLNEWFIHRKDVLILLLSIILSLVFIFSNDETQMQTLRVWTFGGFGYLMDKISAVERYQDVYEENQWLRLENARLMVEYSQLKEAAAENKRLRELLNFKQESKLELVPAKVIGHDQNGFVNSILLTAGRADSIKKNMAVVTSQGLVGKIYRVSQNDATAQLLLDRNFRVSAMVQRSRVMGVVRWTDSNEVALAEVPKRSDVAPGDTVVTSGLSMIYPGGLIIGRVQETDDNNRGMFMEIEIEPVVDFSKLEEVFVIRKVSLFSN